MGHCLSRCIISDDMAGELETNLDDGRSFVQQVDGVHGSGINGGGIGASAGAGGSSSAAVASSSSAGTGIGPSALLPPPPSSTSTFGATSLLAADEVVSLNVLGEGPLGVVHKGTYRGSVVAVKKMKLVARPPSNKPSAWEAIESALELEASRIGSLRHPNMVLFMGACVQGGEFFCIVSEYYSRGSLYNVLHDPTQRPPAEPPLSSSSSSSSAAPPSRGREKSLPRSAKGLEPTGTKKKKKLASIKWIFRIRIALGAAKGLLYLHSGDPPLVHGQLKSTNVLIDDSWNAKLADFGTRRVAEAVGFDRQRMDSVDPDTGLLRWTAPELLKLGEERVLKGQFLQGQAFPQAVDIYSFGMIMWELTTGELPFAELRTNDEIREHVLQGGRPALKPGLCNMKWAELITRCWSRNPARRPTAAEVVSTLEAINLEESLAQAEKKKQRVVNSNRADYRFADKKPSKSKQSSKFRTNVRVPDL